MSFPHLQEAADGPGSASLSPGNWIASPFCDQPLENPLARPCARTANHTISLSSRNTRKHLLICLLSSSLNISTSDLELCCFELAYIGLGSSFECSHFTTFKFSGNVRSYFLILESPAVISVLKILLIFPSPEPIKTSQSYAGCANQCYNHVLRI